MVGIDRQGVTIREWTEGTNMPYYCQEGFFTWDGFKNGWREANLSPGGQRRARMVTVALWMLCHYGGCSDNSGPVGSLQEYVNGHHVFRC